MTATGPLTAPPVLQPEVLVTPPGVYPAASALSCSRYTSKECPGAKQVIRQQQCRSYLNRRCREECVYEGEDVSPGNAIGICQGKCLRHCIHKPKQHEVACQLHYIGLVWGILCWQQAPMSCQQGLYTLHCFSWACRNNYEPCCCCCIWPAGNTT